ncbi:phosphopantetheine-binding protein [Rhodococcus sp. X156]|uniref:phosphopantetheine-binding protein n=1 Tax=Rhodococcus sp. X156 TaxID=2499145 RepID=UPI002408420F|nr:phosphopantetheine-binding protein [Rhodococcus sp. X156]
MDTDQLLTELGDGSRESATETDTAGLDALRDRVAALLGEPAESIDYDDNLVDLGLDSIRLMSLVESTVAAGTTVSFAELSETPTVRSWHAVLQH